jgi:hypothetical protein
MPQSCMGSPASARVRKMVMAASTSPRPASSLARWLGGHGVVGIGTCLQGVHVAPFGEWVGERTQGDRAAEL